MKQELRFIAGRAAFAEIRKNGIDPKQFRVMAGASGGPKWLILSRLDRAIVRTWFLDMQRRESLHTLGSSIGSWRLACYAMANPLAAFERFEDAYLQYRYEKGDSPVKVSADSRRVLDHALGDQGPAEILSHPYIRTNIMAVRSRGFGASEHRALQLPAFIGAAIANGFSRRAGRLFHHRALFYDRREQAPFHNLRDFPIRHIELTEGNFKEAVMASGAIPIFMSGISNIPGAPGGTYRDGGIIDYHFDIPFLGNEKEQGLVLYPHFSDRVVPGWFDKSFKKRRPRPENYARVLMLAPSPEFAASLPYGKIPSRDDFKHFSNGERVIYWRKVLAETDRLADLFQEAVSREQIPGLLEPGPLD